MAAEQIGEPLAAAGKRNISPLRPRGFLYQQTHEIVAPGDRAAGLAQLVGTFFCGFDEVLHVLVRGVGFDRDHRGLQYQPDYRR